MDDRQCLLVIIGATKDGHKELVALEGGVRESEQSWLEMLLDLKRLGLETPPALGIGDGALGFWKALAKAYDTTRWQRCWVHKMANVLTHNCCGNFLHFYMHKLETRMIRMLVRYAVCIRIK